ncbi:GNAT family N-acetyltransferase [Desulfonatronum thiodismutans]|uniref:GNAT family N-acetyltransferase n=1 Tax=Desulfonatronum thiodismutans TaxID=159290 RepID=UPI0004ABECEA|nr:GNAT family N-acetyltransferase [Desulfonatronum thiodismutans]
MAKDVFLWTALSPSQALELDELLWTALWKPLGLDRDVRGKFKAPGRETVIAAEMDGRIIGGLVAVWDDQGEVELRHLAVDADSRGRGVGTRLATTLLESARVQGCCRVHAIARNTSVPFFRKLGFGPAPGTAPQHPLFEQHGIRFELMEMGIGEGARQQDEPEAYG